MSSAAPPAPFGYRQALKAGFTEAVLLVLAAVLLGAVGGFWALAAGDGLADTARVASRPYLAMLAVFPAILIFLTIAPPEIAWYDRLDLSLLVGVVAGGIGGLLGALAYFVPAANLPAYLGGNDAADMYDGVRSEVGLARFLIVVGVSLLVGLASAALTHYRVAAYRRLQRGA